MPKLNYPLKKYIKVIERIAKMNGLDRVESIPNKGSIIRLELYKKNRDEPLVMWTIHHSHSRKKEIWSPEDYKKAARNLNCDYRVFLDEFKK